MDELRNDPTMAYLIDALERGEDIQHYGRLVLAMIARHFLEHDALVALLARGGGSVGEADRLLTQVEQADYSPPKREKILAYQREQAFPIIPHGDDPDAGNVYRTLHFPDHVYEHIAEYREQKAHAVAH